MEQEPEFSEMDIQEFQRCILRGPDIERLYRIYGPTNPTRRNIFSKTQDLVCKKSPNGICHMMTCMCNEDGKDWFTGICDYEECKKKIEKRIDAWRYPDYSGGFVGCFCSQEHYKVGFHEQENGIYQSLFKVCDAIREKYPIEEEEKINNEDDEFM
jgi:hypothetical protein